MIKLLPTGSLKEVNDAELQLAHEINKYRDDPYGFVMFCYAWGEGELAGQTGPDEWQTELLKKIGDELQGGREIDTALRIAVASGHGVGKTALVSWIIHWFESTRPKSQCVVTANTQTQLSTKTWRELAKWHRQAINRHWFVWTATKYYHTLFPELWYASAVPWSKDNSEAFAGTHETTGVLFLFDEASAIDDVIWDVSEGAMTTPGAMWFCFGNPTQTSGKFHDCFHSMKHRWITYKVDSRKAKMASQEQIKEWLDDYGEDSDFFRVRVRGEFPRQSATQFIPADVVLEAMRRDIRDNDVSHHPIILGVDVSRYGSDSTIIVQRQGYKVKTPILKYRILDNMEVAGKVVELYRNLPAGRVIVCVDGTGLGAGVVDRLKQLGLPVIDVQSAERPYDTRTYANKRAENWGRMKDWLIAGGSIPRDPDLEKQLVSLEYGLNKKLQILLQSKEDIRKHGGVSPDIADALAFTFSYDEHKMVETSAKARHIKKVVWV